MMSLYYQYVTISQSTETANRSQKPRTAVEIGVNSRRTTGPNKVSYLNFLSVISTMVCEILGTQRRISIFICKTSFYYQNSVTYI